MNRGTGTNTIIIDEGKIIPKITSLNCISYWVNCIKLWINEPKSPAVLRNIKNWIEFRTYHLPKLFIKEIFLIIKETFCVKIHFQVWLKKINKYINTWKDIQLQSYSIKWWTIKRMFKSALIQECLIAINRGLSKIWTDNV